MELENQHIEKGEPGVEIAPVPSLTLDKATGHLIQPKIEELLHGDNTGKDKLDSGLMNELSNASADLDEESRRWLITTLDHPEWLEPVVAQLTQHKHVTSEMARAYLVAVQDIRITHPDWEAEAARQFNDSFDAKQTAAGEKLQGAIANIHERLGVRAGEAPGEVVMLLPDNKEESGWGMTLDKTAVISFLPDNPDNAQHEYLHSIVNKWVEALPLSEADEAFIRDNAPKTLLGDYGNDARSLLAELIIRTHLYGTSSGGLRPLIIDRVADVLQQYQSQPQPRNSFGEYLKEHLRELTAEK